MYYFFDLINICDPFWQLQKLYLLGYLYIQYTCPLFHCTGKVYIHIDHCIIQNRVIKVV